jgi:predicted dehydrogenase
VVSFKVAWAANCPEASDIRLVGQKAGIYLPELQVYAGADGQTGLTPEKLRYEGAFPGHMYLMDNLRKTLKGEAEPVVKREETLNVSRIIELFYRSAEQGREVFADEN